MMKTRFSSDVFGALVARKPWLFGIFLLSIFFYMVFFFFLFVNLSFELFCCPFILNNGFVEEELCYFY